MAPTSSSSKGANPAPNYTMSMNRIQAQMEAFLRPTHSFLPSRTPQQAPASGSATSSALPQPRTSTSAFSALASTSSARPPAVSAQTRNGTRSQARDVESLFAEDRAGDPNAGIGFGTSSSSRGKLSPDKQKDRETQILRGRLLGRKRGAVGSGNGGGLRRAEQESSDEEAGRSALGRAKKRARRDPEEYQSAAAVSRQSESEPGKAGGVEPQGLRKETVENEAAEEVEPGTSKGEDTALPNKDPPPDGLEGASEQKKKKKRKKQKRKNPVVVDGG
ncbi:hypothetical protein F5Y19DRAFT_199452 [Xylariaceae sp. FL1651]|nr:hypothetical protein F5Y19DRAFT_199452 [Xylariaceae sp. FL1651]